MGLCIHSTILSRQCYMTCFFQHNRIVFSLHQILYAIGCWLPRNWNRRTCWDRSTVCCTYNRKGDLFVTARRRVSCVYWVWVLLKGNWMMRLKWGNLSDFDKALLPNSALWDGICTLRSVLQYTRTVLFKSANIARCFQFHCVLCFYTGLGMIVWIPWQL